MRTYLRRACACVTVTLTAVAAAACFPTSDPSNTGGCTGSSYSDYTGALTRTENGLVLDHLRIHDQLILAGDHQKLMNSCVEGNGTIGVVRVNGTNTLVDHVHVKRKHPSPDTCIPSDPLTDPSYPLDPSSPTGRGLPYPCQGDNGIFVANGPTVVSNDDVSDVAHGIDFETNDVTVTYNYVHDMAYTTAFDHPDGIFFQSGNDNIEVSSNNVTLGSGVTSTVGIYFEAENGDFHFNNVLIKDNWVHDGGGFCMQPDDPAGSATNVQIINNLFGPTCRPGTTHQFAWHNGLVSGTGNVVSGNKWKDDGSPADS